MSSTAYATPLRLDLRPSRTLFWVLTVSHLGAAGLLTASRLPPWAAVALTACVLASYIWLVSRHALLRQAGAVVCLLWGKGNEWRVSSRSGAEILARLSPESFVRPWMTVLLLRPEGGGHTRSVVIMPDTLDAEVFRRLRVRLRLERATVAGQGAQDVEPSS